MIKSMTGYGRAESEIGGKKITIEIKTLNSKQFDLINRIPQIYKEKELEMRSIILQHLERGKIELSITLDESESAGHYTLNRELAKKYHHDISQLAHDLQLDAGSDILATILKLPDVLHPIAMTLDESEWQSVSETLRSAISKCDASRREEGSKLEADFVHRIRLIETYLQEIAPFEGERIGRLREKFRKELKNTFDDEHIDENRFEQEIIYYLEKIDITEEKVRLKNHCEYFLQTLADDTSNGKKLNFISQEIGREINTIGSKAADSNIQKMVVQMKDELEKIKEQLFNIL
ncbi:MAG: YicC/YloC family endoribonuclease [Bacteroidales bacterium]